MFQIGDMIIYGNMGVCRITDIKLLHYPYGDKEKLYYILEPQHQACIVTTPVDSDKVFMRSVITKEEAERLIDMIPSIQVEPYHSRAINELTQHYKASIKTHNCTDLIELAMSLYAKKHDLEQQKKKFGTVDDRFMKRAEDLLFGELSVALGIPMEDVPKYISSRVEGIEQKGMTLNESD